ncbi:MAG: hypothetical protein HC934_08315 [Acaryochloridaceae cyanobacterium SU_2_1]|nr:hypothetical protein [Acaryochloridaceae cyanobacterium SU_2_1]
MSHPAPNWSTGWKTVGNAHSLFNFFKPKALTVVRRQEDGWTDYFIGETQSDSKERQSLLDAATKMALHYRPTQLNYIRQMACPGDDIPAYLWQQLQRQRPSRLSSRY